MRWFILFFALFGNVTAMAGGGVPLLGRSNFDLLIAKNGNQIPETFEELWRLVDVSSLYSGKTSFIPHGRSLQRSTTDFALPRVLYTNGESLHSYTREPRIPKSLSDLVTALPQASIFLAYSKASNSVEIISYNESLGRFEFQILRDFGPGGRAKLMYAPRALCVSCHQNEGPIFSNFPWNETDHNFAVNREMRRVMSPADTHGLLQISDHGTFSETTTSFDFAVRNADRLLRFQKLWRETCGPVGSPEASICHRLLVEMMLADNDHQSSKRAPELAVLGSKTWPKEGLSVSGFELPDRRTHERFTESDLDGSPSIHPLHPRPGVNYLWRGNVSLFGLGLAFTYNELKLIRELIGSSSVSVETLLKEPGFESIWSGEFFDRQAFLEQLAKNLGQKASSPWRDVLQQAEAPILDKFETINVESIGDARLRYFRWYCTECHSGIDAKDPFNFMSVKSDSELTANLRSNPEILKRLLWMGLPAAQQMPPAVSNLGQRLKDRAGDRDAMIEFLREGLPKPAVEVCESKLAPTQETPVRWTDKLRRWFTR